jgi:regulator of protease activity HflC (stomatin/prohibitin superfamily)
MEGGLIFTALLAFVALIVLWKTAIVVPQQSAFVVERLGRYAGTLDAGFHILVPFVDVVRYRHSLKEAALDIPAQICITRDNVQVQVDGVLYLKVLNPERTSYGISDYIFAISQLAQTTLRSEVGKIDLDRTFEERTNINIAVVAELDKATEPWGVKVLRYEIKNITPPADVLAAMEKQMRAGSSRSTRPRARRRRFSRSRRRPRKASSASPSRPAPRAAPKRSSCASPSSTSTSSAR